MEDATRFTLDEAGTRQVVGRVVRLERELHELRHAMTIAVNNAYASGHAAGYEQARQRFESGIAVG